MQRKRWQCWIGWHDWSKWYPVGESQVVKYCYDCKKHKYMG